MNLDQISFKLRARSPWEAVDLGFVLARQWWKVLFLSWLLPPLTLFVICSLIFIESPWIAYLIVWWLKPFWDRAPLYIASKALFGEQVSVLHTLMKLPSLFRKDWLAWLTWRRLSFTRSFDMPVTVLESLTFKPRASRLRVLHYGSGSTAFWLTTVCVHMEILISLGIIAMVFWLLPQSLEIDWMGIAITDQLIPLHINNLLGFVGMALIAPFYTMAGFALYISRRIDLEAWDIEIRFRHIATAYGRGREALLAIFMAVGITMLATSPQAALAEIEHTADAAIQLESEAVDTSNWEREQAKTAIESVLNGEAFHAEEEVSGWRLKDWEDNPEEVLPEWIIKLIEFFERNAGFFDSTREFFSSAAAVLEFILWVLLISVFIYFFYRYREKLQNFIGAASGNSKAVAPQALFGLDVRQESLPEDVPFRVRQLWANGEARLALSLLYRATLSSLIHNYNLQFFDGDTEDECLQIVRRHGDQRLSEYTRNLTRCWQRLAYGHQLPESELVDDLCDQWRQVFHREQ